MCPLQTSSSGPSDLRTKFRHAFPDFTLQKFKEKTPDQLLVLEASFQKSDTPSDEELSRLRAETKLTRREVDAWFTERRKIPSSVSAALHTSEVPLKNTFLVSVIPLQIFLQLMFTLLL